ncbi:hypothetical protein GCM10009092_24510 [Bowmanella denitrificans]|uniref:Uncharacterized protein n=1 Tax=Bowmanella denitrificans TaxID=366582 RepID=A0ABP3H0J3_9ALTE
MMLDQTHLLSLLLLPLITFLVGALVFNAVERKLIKAPSFSPQDGR